MNHTEQILRLLHLQIENDSEVEDIRVTALEVANHWVNPVSGGTQSTNGLIYGLVQSGKTGILTATGAMAADEGYRTLIILTSDIEPLYLQTLARVQAAFPGIDVISKTELKDADDFLRRIKSGNCAIVTTKNSRILGTLIENLQKGRVRGLSCIIFDDEADQASLNTRASRADGSVSTINDRITQIRGFFEKNTYIQVTATPQALFLQVLRHDFRPQFSVLSHPGSDYVGGDDFFGDNSDLVREFDLNDIALLSPGSQPAPRPVAPASLLRALDTFMVAATYKRLRQPDQNCAFLCHVSTRTADHKHIVNVLRQYKIDLAEDLAEESALVLKRLHSAYEDLLRTHGDIASVDFEEIRLAIAFLSPGITVKLVNGETDEDVAVNSPYNLFVGGNKLGRGVTIRNLLVSYYGRHPKRPQADTVLQHARMYGYRRKDLGLLRIFLPRELHVVFRAINQMERGLRDLIARQPTEEFRGIYLESGLSPTRKNILAPGSIGVYTGGSNYNPANVTRGDAVAVPTSKINRELDEIPNKEYREVPITKLRALLNLTVPDPSQSERIWNSVAIGESLEEFAKLSGHSTGYVYVDRDRDLRERRRETQGILSGGEKSNFPSDKIVLVMLRTTPGPDGNAAWWPEIRFPGGRYAFAFAI